jgi:hypothetical protein
MIKAQPVIGWAFYFQVLRVPRLDLSYWFLYLPYLNHAVYVE